MIAIGCTPIWVGYLSQYLNMSKSQFLHISISLYLYIYVDQFRYFFQGQLQLQNAFSVGSPYAATGRQVAMLPPIGVKGRLRQLALGSNAWERRRSSRVAVFFPWENGRETRKNMGFSWWLNGT